MSPSDRRDATITLLRSRHAWHPTLRSQFSTFGALPGETATEWVMCRSCNGDGTIRGRKGLDECKTCAGEGRYLVDSYTRKPAAELSIGRQFTGPEREQWRRLTDASIGRLTAQTTPPRTELDLIADATPYPWERDRARHYAAGDYRALDLALEWLATESPLGRAMVGWVYESGALELGCLHQSILHAADLAVTLLTERMPDPVRVPPWLAAKHPALERRDRKAA